MRRRQPAPDSSLKGMMAARVPGQRVPREIRPRLSELERAVIDAALTGTLFEAAPQLPAEDDMGHVVRARVVRDALAGVYGPLHHRGLQLRGLRIADDLDLSYLSWRGALGRPPESRHPLTWISHDSQEGAVDATPTQTL